MQLIQRFNAQPRSGWPFSAADRHFRAGSWVQSFGLMDWQPEALAALKKDVQFFVRPAVRKRVEAMADSDGRSDIDLDFYKSAKQAMAPS